MIWNVLSAGLVCLWLSATILVGQTAPLNSEQNGPVIKSTEGKKLPGLEFVILEINGNLTIVPEGTEYSVTEGDTLIIRSVELTDKKVAPEYVNFEGYPNKNRTNSVDDRGYVINTATDLLQRWALPGRKATYRIAAYTDNQSHGRIYIKVVKAELIYAMIRINGIDLRVKAGELIRAKDKDYIKVIRIETNLKKSDVYFNIEKLKDQIEDKKYQRYQIQFIYQSSIFARIPFEVEAA